MQLARVARNERNRSSGHRGGKVEEMTKMIEEKVQDLRCVRMKLNKSVISFVIGRKGVKFRKSQKE